MRALVAPVASISVGASAAGPRPGVPRPDAGLPRPRARRSGRAGEEHPAPARGYCAARARRRARPPGEGGEEERLGLRKRSPRSRARSRPRRGRARDRARASSLAASRAPPSRGPPETRREWGASGLRGRTGDVGGALNAAERKETLSYERARWAAERARARRGSGGRRLGRGFGRVTTPSPHASPSIPESDDNIPGGASATALAARRAARIDAGATEEFARRSSGTTIPTPRVRHREPPSKSPRTTTTPPSDRHLSVERSRTSTTTRSATPTRRTVLNLGRSSVPRGARAERTGLARRTRQLLSAPWATRWNSSAAPRR